MDNSDYKNTAKSIGDIHTGRPALVIQEHIANGCIKRFTLHRKFF